MSTVRMCDKCGAIFPEGVEGSGVGQATMMVKDSRGRTVPETRTQDICPLCSNGGTPTPRLALTDGQADRVAMTQ